jgi:hypothetical protein
MGNHLYDQNILPPPTINDIAHIAHETHQTWRFERTVHQNEHRRNRRRGIYHRIVHLFVRVDDYGQVVDVSSIVISVDALLIIVAAHGR